MSEIKFRPIRGTELEILGDPNNSTQYPGVALTEGALLITTDTGKIFYDTATRRIALSGGGSGGLTSGTAIFYGMAPANLQDVPVGSGIFTLKFEYLEDSTIIPRVGDLIFNNDGCFYRVTSIVESEQKLICSRLMTGGGGSTVTQEKIKVEVKNLEGVSTLINGQSAKALIKVYSGLDTDGSVLDAKNQLSVTVTLQVEASKDNWVTYYTETFYDLDHEEEFEFDFGKYARESSRSRLLVIAEGANSGKSTEKNMGAFTTGELTLTLAEHFSNQVVFDMSSINITCNAIGGMERMLDFYWDEELIHSVHLLSTDTGREITCEVQKYTNNVSHGYHKVRIELYQYVKEERKLGTAPISFEVAVSGGSSMEDAIIWLGDYRSEYYNYDDIEIPYTVWVPHPAGGNVSVNILKNNILIATRNFENVSGPISTSYEIVDADEGGMQNYYTIACGDSSRDIFFRIVDDPKRDMHLQKPLELDIKFDAKGNSNDDSETKRESWGYTDRDNVFHKAKFNNFNWYNNGWIKTNEGTALRISNGASFSIPIAPMTFGGSGAGNVEHTFEFQFKIRNVQSYQSLISNITRYKQDADYYNEFYGHIAWEKNGSDGYNPTRTYYYIDENDKYVKAGVTSAATFESAAAAHELWYGTTEAYKTSYTNYDAFLQHYAATHGLDYDVITKDYDYTQKIFNLSALACGFYSGDVKAPVGFGLGPQDAFFSNGTNTVNASYVEDKMVNLAITYGSDKLMSIYVNGVLTGVVSSTLNGSFKIDSTELVFNSLYCDIDLYKFRVYRQALTIGDIVTNYAVDLKDVIIYDQNTLVNANNKYLFDFKSMLDYNDLHADDPIMPYIVFDTSKSDNGDRLSWSKKTKVTIDVEFVNTVLDRAWISGEIESLAAEDSAKYGRTITPEEYYLHHCPSWKGSGIEMAVQGTSSEFYPRRNYKLKTKGKDKKIHMTAHKGPYLTENKHLDWFYMDNYSVGTTKFTMKIDFMESSGSYNRGLANLIHNAHSEHPLAKYNSANAFSKAENSFVPYTGEFNAGTEYYYLNHKANPKVFVFSEDPEVAAAQFAAGPIATVGPTDSNKVMGGSETYNVEYALQNAEEGNKKFAVEANLDKWMIGGKTYSQSKVDNNYVSDLRTNVQGFPVLAFHKKSDGTYTYIGRYNMLTDKGSDETFGFKLDGFYAKYLDNKKVSDIVECWEFENNARGFCSFRDPKNRRHLSFNTGEYLGESEGDTSTAPLVVEDFEYRYHALKDGIDLIVGPDATRMDSLTTEQIAEAKKQFGVEITSNEIGQDVIYDVYGNWEKACQWVWSTALDVPFVKKEAEIAEMNEEDKKQYLIEDYFKLEDDAEYDSSKKYFEYKRHLYEPYVYNAETWETDRANLFELRNYTKQFTSNGTVYMYDSYEYRCEKFKAELTKHFDLDYLATYFVATEVLELYDSRGKNAMFASWGPMEEGGDYIWFPIFYDMDTQLGINNTGIPSFEFSIDATPDGTFSTNDSILWNNFYLLFKNQMIEKYRQLKGQTSGIGSFKPLSHAPFASCERIEAWYESDPKVCRSVTMRGQRPLSAINLDEYYKYIAITNAAGGGYLGQSGEIKYDNVADTDGTGQAKGSYYYALQGDRSLSRIQFLQNRINYVDSWLGVGSYEKSGADDACYWGRFRSNDVGDSSLISDIWTDDETYKGTPHYAPYFQEDGVTKTHEFDAEWWLTLTPSRKSYVAIIADDSKYTNKYIDTPVKVEMTSREDTIRTKTEVGESLFYLLGVDTMKDIGDLYKLYITELHTISAPALTDLRLGWDGLDESGNPYKNYNTNQFTLSSMPLLQELNFSNIQFSNINNATLDLTKSEKLKNFRATGSNLLQVKFAQGVALDTLYLPQTITTLELTEARQLKNIVTTYEVPKKDVTTGKLNAKKGLYLEHFTDYLDDIENAQTGLQTLSILNASNLGYDAYKLLNGFYKVKKNNPGVTKIAMTNVDWSPYKLVDEGAAYDESLSYYIDNNHYQFVPYSYNPGLDDSKQSTWTSLIANEKLYYLDTEEYEKSKDLIVDIQMFKDFVDQNNFKGTVDGIEIPNVSGIVYINNNSVLDGVDEYYIRNTFQAYFPKMKFFFANINSGYTARFVLVDEENPKIQTEIGIQTIASSSDAFINPITAYGDISDRKANYDFFGWSNTAEGSEILCSLEDPNGTWNNLTLQSDVHDYTFYAIFSIHKYNITFYDGNGTDQYVKKITYGLPLEAPGLSEFIPYKDDSALERDKTYKFVGWALTPEGATVDLSRYNSTKDYEFYSVFKKVSVYDTVLDESYFTVEPGTYSPSIYSEEFDNEYTIEGWVIINLKAKKTLKGKITLPSYLTVNGQTLPVIIIYSDVFAQETGITHVFFEKNNKAGDCKLRMIYNSAFQGCSNLTYIEFPESLRQIQTYAFNGCKLRIDSIDPGNLIYIGASAFQNCLWGGESDTMPFSIYIGGSIRSLGTQAIANNNRPCDTIQIGKPGDPSQLQSISLKAIRQNDTYPIKTLKIYCTADRYDWFNSQIGTTDTEGIVVAPTTQVSINI